MKNTAETHDFYSLAMACSGGKGKTWNRNPFIKKDEQDLMALGFLGGGIRLSRDNGGGASLRRNGNSV